LAKTIMLHRRHSKSNLPASVQCREKESGGMADQEEQSKDYGGVEAHFVRQRMPQRILTQSTHSLLFSFVDGWRNVHFTAEIVDFNEKKVERFGVDEQNSGERSLYVIPKSN
jgi:hypothetical protein